MILEALAIWAIIVATTIWFFRDEQRQRNEELAAQAMLYATAPAYRHRLAAVATTRSSPELQLISTDVAARRRFLAALQR
jgi:hypothetical protein